MSRSSPFRPVGEGLVPSRPPTHTGTRGGGQAPALPNDGTDAMAISMRSDPLGGSSRLPALAMAADEIHQVLGQKAEVTIPLVHKHKVIIKIEFIDP